MSVRSKRDEHRGVCRWTKFLFVLGDAEVLRGDVVGRGGTFLIGGHDVADTGTKESLSRQKNSETKCESLWNPFFTY